MNWDRLWTEYEWLGKFKVEGNARQGSLKHAEVLMQKEISIRKIYGQQRTG